MKGIQFTKEQKLLNHIVLHAKDVPAALGLLNGQMGITIVLAHYARTRNNSQIEKVSDVLLEGILQRLTKTTSIDFADGLCGIAWGIEYLIQNGFMKGCGAEILQDVDKKIMERDVLRIEDFSLETGLEGMLHYVLAHLQGANKDGCGVFDKEYLDAWVKKLQKLSLNKTTKEKFEPLFGKLLEAINGSWTAYSFDLIQFIHHCNDNKLLSLNGGTAGQLELLISQNNQAL